MNKDELRKELIKKINFLNQIQIERMDQYRVLISEGCNEDLLFLDQVINKELKRYQHYYTDGLIIISFDENNNENYNNENYTDGTEENLL